MFTSIHLVDISFTIDPSQVLLSLKNDSYLPLPEIGTILQEGDTYAILKNIDIENRIDSINFEPYEIKAPTTCQIHKIEFYINSWNEYAEEYNYFIKSQIGRQSTKFVHTRTRLQSFLDNDSVDKFLVSTGISNLDLESKLGKYSYKSNKIKGILVKITGIYEEEISIGDKIANRHGNKGVISKIIPDNEMPVLEDGRRLDIIINPMGIISRMNVGQIYELHLNEVLHNVRENLKTLNLEDRVAEVTKIAEFIDKTPDKWVTKEILDIFDPVNPYTLRFIIPSFLGISPEDLISLMNYTNSSQYLRLFDPETNEYLENPIACGYIYFMKLVHRSSEKKSSRSIGPYSPKVLQPISGRKNNGGHRLGEMEVWSLLAHGANGALESLLTVHSDSIGKKSKLLASIIGNPNILRENGSEDDTPQSSYLFQTYLKILGIELKDVNEENNINDNK
jgi:DNA-directed RNA polymerase subunit beta